MVVRWGGGWLKGEVKVSLRMCVFVRIYLRGYDFAKTLECPPREFGGDRGNAMGLCGHCVLSGEWDERGW